MLGKIFGNNDKKIQEAIDSGDFGALPTEMIDDLAKDLIVTTEPNMPEYRVVERIEIITAECVFGMNLFRDFFASVRDIFGGRSGAAQKVLRESRKTCLTELKREALISGANAIIGVDLDYSEISGDGKSMLFLVASGTAVRVEKI